MLRTLFLRGRDLGGNIHPAVNSCFSRPYVADVYGISTPQIMLIHKLRTPTHLFRGLGPGRRLVEIFFQIFFPSYAAAILGTNALRSLLPPLLRAIRSWYHQRPPSASTRARMRRDVRGTFLWSLASICCSKHRHTRRAAMSTFSFTSGGSSSSGNSTS